MPARVILGNLGGIYRLRVSKPGVDVFTATDPDIILDSSFAAARLLAVGSVVLAGGANTGSGFVPGQVVNIPVPAIGNGEPFISLLVRNVTSGNPFPLGGYVSATFSAGNLRISNDNGAGQAFQVCYGVWGY